LISTAAADRQRLILVAGLLAALLLCCGPVFDPDLPWHLSAGRQYFAMHAVPRQDFLSRTMAGRPWIDFEWAAEALFYGIEKYGGGSGFGFSSRRPSSR